MPDDDPPARSRSLRALDVLNFFMADVRDGVGPYLMIFLESRPGWTAGRRGIALAMMTIAQVVAQTPAGALIDRTRFKRALIVGAALVVGIGALEMVRHPTFAAVLTWQALMGAASATFAPAIAAISLGLVGHARLPRRMGRNEAANHAGNVAAALLAGYIGYQIAPRGVFNLLALMSALTALSTLAIGRRAIDHDLARGGAAPDGADGSRVARLGELWADRRIIIFGAAVTLFHLANAAMLPKAGEKLASDYSKPVAIVAMSACIVAAQLVMIPVAILASRWAETWGRKPVFLIGFVVLPIRGLLYTFNDHPYYIVAVQLLDGVGAGIFGVVGVLVIADLTRGTGRFNLMQGALATATGLGASLSNIMTGYIVQAAGFNAGFLVLALIAAVAAAFFWWAMPETRPAGPTHPAPDPDPTIEPALAT